ncbi:acid phosphatase [Sphingomonas sp.]|uniref:acid phosphatase n=1 Tax=Sphingomonas sp. TaxID=28214 RepID=UPI003B3B3CB4
MTRKAAFAFGLLALAGASIAAAPATGYLDGVFDLTTIVPPAPVKGDIRYAADRKVFKATRAMLGTPRGTLATEDVPSSVIAVEKDFSCAAAVTLSPETTPATHRLLAAANADTARANNAAKDHWQRLRPFLIDKGPVCDSKEELAKSYDYPSGHATRGWTFGLILSEAEPDRATPILIRARAYGESRIVCGAHNMSAIDAGRTGASATMQAIRATDAYQRDLAAARRELAAARANPALAPDAASCSAEAALTAPSVLAAVRK